MKSILRMGGGALLLFAAISGCNDAKPPSGDAAKETSPSPSDIQENVEYFAPGPEFKLSREAARQKAEAEKQSEDQLASTDASHPKAASVPETPRRRTIFESLYEAVRNGAAEALDEQAASP